MTAFAGFAFVVLSAVAAVLVGDAPGVSASATEVADYFDDEHSRVVTAAYLQGVFLIDGLTYAGDGFWAPDGDYSRVAYLGFLAWTAATAGRLLGRD